MVADKLYQQHLVVLAIVAVYLADVATVGYLLGIGGGTLLTLQAEAWDERNRRAISSMPLLASG